MKQTVNTELQIKKTLDTFSSQFASEFTSALAKLDEISIRVNGGLNAQKPEADIWRIMPPYFDQEKGGDLAPF
jgi:hypothetical protein